MLGFPNSMSERFTPPRKLLAADAVHAQKRVNRNSSESVLSVSYVNSTFVLLELDS